MQKVAKLQFVWQFFCYILLFVSGISSIGSATVSKNNEENGTTPSLNVGSSAESRQEKDKISKYKYCLFISNFNLFDQVLVRSVNVCKSLHIKDFRQKKFDDKLVLLYYRHLHLSNFFEIFFRIFGSGFQHFKVNHLYVFL